MRIIPTTAAILCLGAGAALAAAHAPTPSVEATDQSVANGVVSAEKIVAALNREVRATKARFEEGGGADEPEFKL